MTNCEPVLFFKPLIMNYYSDWSAHGIVDPRYPADTTQPGFWSFQDNQLSIQV